MPGVCRAPSLPLRPVSAALRPRTLLHIALLHTPDLLPCALYLWFKINTSVLGKSIFLDGGQAGCWSGGGGGGVSVPGDRPRPHAGAPDEGRRPQRVALPLLPLLEAVDGAGGGPHPLLHHHVLAATAPLAPAGAGQGVVPGRLQQGHFLTTWSCHCKSAAVSRWQRRICSGHKTHKLWCCQYYNSICECTYSSSSYNTTCVRGCGGLLLLAGLLLLHLLRSPGLLRTDHHLGPRMRSAAHLATSTEESLSVLLVLARLLRSPRSLARPPSSDMGVISAGYYNITLHLK